MKTINQLLTEKGNQVWSLNADASVYEAIELMAEKGVGAIAIVDGEALVGMVSERDYARKVILMNRSSKDTPIREIMTSQVVTARPDNTVQECLGIMTDHRFRHLPIMDGERLVGMISIGDLVKSVISEQRATIEQLERYITS